MSGQTSILVKSQSLPAVVGVKPHFVESKAKVCMNLLRCLCITTVNFPVKNLELKDIIPLPPAKETEKVRSKYDLIANLVHDGKPGEGYYRVFVQRKSEEIWQVSNFSCHLISWFVECAWMGELTVCRMSPCDRYEMQDLHVAETLPQMVALSEAYMQIYEQQL